MHRHVGFTLTRWTIDILTAIAGCWSVNPCWIEKLHSSVLARPDCKSAFGPTHGEVEVDHSRAAPFLVLNAKHFGNDEEKEGSVLVG